MSIKLRELIRSIRACKTAAEERAVIARECALIRTAFKEEDNSYRHRNVAKLLFIHMLGYPTHFGQMECLKLVSSQRFAEKRVGYLGMTQLLDENTDVLMLVTNSIKNDLNNSYQFVQGLALCSLGNIGSTEMCMVLSREVERMFSMSNPYIRKKAALCSIRIVRKVQEIEDKFNHKIPQLMEDRNHGVLLGATSLVIALCDLNRSYADEFRPLVPTIIRTLKNMLMSGYSNASEYDYSGITDPFLQVKLLRTLRVLGQGNQEASDEMNDILAQVATNTEGSKNAGNAILYECVQTIMMIQAESGLRVLGINILGRFLLNRDNNIRYVALTTLKKVVKVDIKAVQRHRTTILDCLKDNDISIRKRALDVAYSLVNDENIKHMTKELLNYLLVADLEFKEELVSKVCLCADRFSPNKRWHVDTMLKIMCLAGNYVREELRSKFCTVVAANPELHSYTVHKIFFSMKENLTQESLIIAGVWCVGEFGDLLVSGTALGPDQRPIKVAPSEVIDLIQEITKMNIYADKGPGQTVVLEYIASALIKLVTRLPSELERIRKLLQKFEQSISMELQQRSCEYQELLTPVWDAHRAGVLDRMPVSDKINLNPVLDDDNEDNQFSYSKDGKTADGGDGLPPSGAAAAPDLLDLLDLGGDEPTTASVPAHIPAASPVSGSGALDLLDLIGGDPIPAATPSVPASTHAFGGADGGLLDLIGGGSLPSGGAVPSASTPTTMEKVIGFDKDGLAIEFESMKLPPQAAGSASTITARFYNRTGAVLTDFIFEAAVPKYLQLSLQSAASNIIQPGTSDVTQVLNILNSTNGEKPILMKLRIGYTKNGVAVTELGNVGNLPKGL